jgi:DNA polymerase-3 subunit gamma/tau
MSDSFDLDEPPQPAKAEVYRVLARKYRPQTFAELIGQDAMVTTLGNAIKRGRLAHAFLLTGVRGVGKTSTARLIAKALNCIGPDGEGGPTIDPCGVCEPCRAIAEGRHIDVIEMDAASHTGVDDVREIIDASRYAAVSARYKIYIIDEVHMLSKNAFNALLKTLEEPPAHVKFLFATTEVNKVLIARAAEGSARDGLSILDQAIAHAGIEGGGVKAAAVREMLGLSDRGAVRALLGVLLTGDGLGALAALRRQYDLGVDPQAVMRALLEAVHATTLVKLGTAPDAGQAVEEREAQEEWAGGLSFAALHRLWQLLLKGHDEVARAALPIEACEMALLRVVHASTLPDPGELARQLAAGGPVPAVAAAPAAPTPVSSGTSGSSLPGNFVGLVGMLDDQGEAALAARLSHSASLVRYAPGELVLSSARPMPADFVRELTLELKRITGKQWRVSAEDVPGEPTLNEVKLAAAAAERAAILETPVVKAAFEAFPDAELDSWTTEIRSNEA